MMSQDQWNITGQPARKSKYGLYFYSLTNILDNPFTI